jgi:hypothetical protein
MLSHNLLIIICTHISIKPMFFLRFYLRSTVICSTPPIPCCFLSWVKTIFCAYPTSKQTKKGFPVFVCVMYICACVNDKTVLPNLIMRPSRPKAANRTNYIFSVSNWNKLSGLSMGNNFPKLFHFPYIGMYIVSCSCLVFRLRTGHTPATLQQQRIEQPKPHRHQ